MKAYTQRVKASSDEYETPKELFDELDEEFRFTLDPCSSDENAKCQEHYTALEDGLAQDWSGHRVFCNPPYSNVAAWAEKAYREGLKDNTIVVLLVPARTDTRWFHNYIYRRSEIRFIKGRLRFDGHKVNAPFPSMIAIFRGAYT